MSFIKKILKAVVFTTVCFLVGSLLLGLFVWTSFSDDVPEIGPIVSIDDRLVKSPTHAMRILRSYDPEETITLEIVRRGRRETIETTMPEHRVKILDKDWIHRWRGGWHDDSEE